MANLTGRARGVVRWALRILTGAATLWTAILAFQYLSDARVPRYRVESAALAFVMLGVALRLAGGRKQGAVEAPGRPLGAIEWVAWSAGALVLYAPSLRIGLLSDDFGLAALAMRWQFGPVHPEFFRPLPLVLWSALLHGGGSAVALHLVNVLLHGSVAFLTARLATSMVTPGLARLAGLVVLTAPASVEAVAWSSGIFDISATVLLLVAVVVSRGYGQYVDRGRRTRLLAIASAAVLCKETALVAPALIAMDAWAGRRLTRGLRLDLAILALLFAVVGAVRLMLASPEIKEPLTKYAVQRWLFGTVGGLVAPWHSELQKAAPALAVVTALAVILLVAVFFLGSESAPTVRFAAASVTWMLVATAPAITFFFVAPDLQNARLLYLATVGYGWLLACLAARHSNSVIRGIAGSLIGIVVLSAMAGTLFHQRYWREAAVARDDVLGSARENGQISACGRVNLLGLPDSVHGAYVFRNGAADAFAQIGIELSESAESSCVFTWDDERKTFDRAGT